MEAIDATGFGVIARALPIRMSNLSHLVVTAVIERWSETPHPFHFAIGKVTITPSDIVGMTSLPWEGDVIHFDAFMSQFFKDKHVSRRMTKLFEMESQAGKYTYEDLYEYWTIMTVVV